MNELQDWPSGPRSLRSTKEKIDLFVSRGIKRHWLRGPLRVTELARSETQARSRLYAKVI